MQEKKKGKERKKYKGRLQKNTDSKKIPERNCRIAAFKRRYPPRRGNLMGRVKNWAIATNVVFYISDGVAKRALLAGVKNALSIV